MKRILLPCALLLALLVLSLWNARHTAQLVEPMCRTLEAALNAGEDAVPRLVETAQQVWQAHRRALHLVVAHNVIDGIDAQFLRALRYAEAGETAECRAELSALIAALRLLAQTQALSAHNIL